MINIDVDALHDVPYAMATLLREMEYEHEEDVELMIIPQSVTITIDDPTKMFCYWPEIDQDPFCALLEAVRFASCAAPRKQTGRWVHDTSVFLAVDLIKDDNTSVPIPLPVFFKDDTPASEMITFIRREDTLTALVNKNHAVGNDQEFYTDIGRFLALFRMVAHYAGLAAGPVDVVVSSLYFTPDQDIEHFMEMADAPLSGPYRAGIVEETDLFSGNLADWVRDARLLAECGPTPMGIKDSFLRRVFNPMLLAMGSFALEPDGKFLRVYKMLEHVESDEWRLAGQNWVNRRWEAHRAED